MSEVPESEMTIDGLANLTDEEASSGVGGRGGLAAAAGDLDDARGSRTASVVEYGNLGDDSMGGEYSDSELARRLEVAEETKAALSMKGGGRGGGGGGGGGHRVFFSTDGESTQFKNGQYPLLEKREQFDATKGGIVVEESHIVEEETLVSRVEKGDKDGNDRIQAGARVNLGPSGALKINEKDTFYTEVEDEKTPPESPKESPKSIISEQANIMDTGRISIDDDESDTDSIRDIPYYEFKLHEGSGTAFFRYDPDERDPSRDRSLFAFTSGLELGHHPDAVTCCEWVGLDMIATSCADGNIRVWEGTTGKLVHMMRGHANVATTVRVGHDHHTLVSGSLDHTIRLWNMGNWDPDGERQATLVEERVLMGHSRGVYGVALSPSGNIIASGSSDRTVRIWSVTDGRLMHTINQHRGPVHTVAFTPRGDQVLSASEDTTVGVWDVQTGKEVSRLRGHYKFATHVTGFPSLSQPLVLSSSSDGTLRLWDLRMDHPATTVEQVGETAGEVLIRREKVVVEGSTAINAERWARFRSFRPDLWTMDRPKRELSKKAIHVVDEKDPTDDSLPLRRGTCARFRPDGGGIVSVGEDGRLLSYELRKGGARLTASATLQAEVVYSDMGDSYLQRKPRTVALEINHCAFAPNKSMRATRIPVAIATGKYDNALRIVELRRDIIT